MAGRRRVAPSRSALEVDGARGAVEVAPFGSADELAAWARGHRDRVRELLTTTGAVLFRGSDVGAAGFPAVTRALAGEPVAYHERSSPRTELGDRVYTATDHPAHQRIPLHHECSYQATFPEMLVFGCFRPAARGGATLLADGRRVLARIDPGVVTAFRERSVTYVRNFGLPVGLSWQDAFQTDDPAAVDAYCHRRGVRTEWVSDSRLRTRAVRPVVLRHPRAGADVWFNHALFFHVTSLDPVVSSGLREQFDEADLPANTYYGDGGSIELDVLDHLRSAYAAEEHVVEWQRGDVLLIDNMLAAHGRAAFTGRREVVVSMVGEHTWPELEAGTPVGGTR